MKLRDFGHITFRNIEVKAARPFRVFGTPDTPVRGVRFENIRGKVKAECPFEVKNAEGFSLDRVTLTR